MRKDDPLAASSATRRVGGQGTLMRVIRNPRPRRCSARVSALVAIMALTSGMTAAVWSSGAAEAAAVAVGGSAGSWGQAIEVPGLAALNTGGLAEVTSVSCGSAGNCAAAGNYYAGDVELGFVTVERNGVWGSAIEVPGLATLNKGAQAPILSLSCATAGSCAAGGFFNDVGGGQQGFVVTERNGVWGKAIEVPGLAALNKHGTAEVNSVSCSSAGNCAAGGKYRSGNFHLQGFVVTERNGVWGKAIEVPGLAALHKRGGDATVFSVSCASAGNCSAGGSYHLSHHHQGFVVTERNGVWGKAIAVPGLAALNAGGQATVKEVSCAAAGNCAASGNYLNRGGQAFVVVERNGNWDKAIEIPGLAAISKTEAEVDSVSCGAAGSCAAGGNYVDLRDHYHLYVAVERHGRWGQAIEIPGLRALSTGGFGFVSSVSCASAGNCVVGGGYSSSSGEQGFLAVEKNGRWGKAIEVPGLAALNTGGNANVSSVSCPPAGTCSAGGSYVDHDHNFQGFVVSQDG